MQILIHSFKCKTLASQYASTIRKQNEVIAQEQARQEKARKEAEEKAKKAAKAGTKPVILPQRHLRTAEQQQTVQGKFLFQ